MVHMTERMKEIDAQVRAQIEAAIHSDDPERRCFGTMRKAIVGPFREALTGLMVEGNDPEQVITAVCQALGACVAIAAFQYGSDVHAKANICTISGFVHEWAHQSEAHMKTVPVDVDTKTMTITDKVSETP